MPQKGVAPTARQLELLQLARPAKRTQRAIVVGLDGVGKTSILAALRTGRAAEGVALTQGCNKCALVCHAWLEPRTSRRVQRRYRPATHTCEPRGQHRDDVSGRWTPESGDHASFCLELLDVGGGSGARTYWPQLAARSTAILAVVDGRETDAARWAALAAALEELRGGPELSAAPLVLVVNRRGVDERTCVSPSEALARLRLGGLADAASSARLRLGSGGAGARVVCHTGPEPQASRDEAGLLLLLLTRVEPCS
jgi:hypothetical protein